jgi:PAS domain S-box-containing protein
MDLHRGQEQRQVLEAKPNELRRMGRVGKNQEWYQDLVEHSQDLLCVHDLQGHLLSVNAAPARVLGYSVEELLNIPMRELIPPEFRSQFDSYLSEIESKGEARGFLALKTRSGERRIWQYYNTLRTEEGSVPIVRGIAHDVTEQLRTEKLLREAGEGLLREVRNSEQTIQELKLFRTLVDHSNDAIEVVDPETLRFLDVNEKACSTLGYSREEMLSLKVLDIDPTSTPLSLAKIKGHLQKSGFFMLETLHQRKNGSVFPVEVSMRCVRLERDYIVAIARDLTERNQAEERLREYERAVEGLEEMIVVMDRDYRYVIANRAALNYRGLKKEQLIGRSFREQLIADGASEETMRLIKQKMDECFQGRMVQYETRYTYPKLGERDILLSYVPIEGAAGVDRIACIVRDITERKRAEVRLREYERVVEGLEEMIVVVDRDYRYVIANRAFLRNRGRKKEEVIGRRVDEIVHREVFDSLIKQKMDECFMGNVVAYDMKYTYPELGERDLFVTYFPIEGPTGVERIAGILRDVTERNRGEQALRYAKDFSQNLIQTANVMIVGLDTNGNVNLLNEAGEEITGYSFSELKDKNWSTLVPRDRFPHVWGEFERLVEGTAGRTFENPILTKAGDERQISWRNSQVKIDGKVVATISFGNDVTESKRAERALRYSEEQYRLFISQSSEGIFCQDMKPSASIDLPEDELIHHILYDSYLVECNDAMAAMYGLKSAQELQGKRLTEMLPPEDPHNIELTRHYIRTGFRVLDRESHEIDIHGNPKVFLNSLIGTVENGMLVRTWGIQRDVTEKVKLDESRQKAEEALRENVAQLQLVTEELRVAKEKLSEEKLYLEQAITTELGFSEIIGRSNALKDVMDKAAKVAPSDATVLVLGETGTGKELVARAIHRLSNRKDNSFIKLNCAAIPSGLLESELFGHEKGAFTGAVAKKLGRLELADKGTLFLDEIGEVSLDLQPKLLRVLQDQEFERLGGTQTLKVNFRLVAATNRDLLDSVNRREFRTDLYYRLNVFPLRTPPLRERREDIPLLIEHFVRKYASRMNKSILSIPARTMETLMQWGWPGNIRELENFVERSVILTPGSVLQVPLSELHAEPGREQTETLRDTERERILRALRECGGQLGGPNGAAARLGLKRTTLQSKLNAFGIDPGGYRA